MRGTFKLEQPEEVADNSIRPGILKAIEEEDDPALLNSCRQLDPTGDTERLVGRESIFGEGQQLQTTRSDRGY